MSTGNPEEIIDEAARWAWIIEDGEDADETQRRAFDEWLRISPRHMEEFLIACAINDALEPCLRTLKP